MKAYFVDLVLYIMPIFSSRRKDVLELNSTLSQLYTKPSSHEIIDPEIW